jgi:hypothetical protein
MPTAALQAAEWQWRASVFTDWHCAGRYSGLFNNDFILQLYMPFWFGCLSDIPYSFSVDTLHYFT